MLRDKTLLKSLHDGPCQPLSCSQSRRDDTSSPWKPITQVHPVYYPRARDTQDEWLLYSLFAAWLYVLLKFHKMEDRRIVNVVRLIDIDVAGERKSRTPGAFAARPFYNGRMLAMVAILLHPEDAKVELSFVHLSDAGLSVSTGVVAGFVYICRERRIKDRRKK